ncbi:hypothetical protein QE152_g13583 [Popillia japonica]|uniref:Uncharacterized protein n=1 Tax=Popillia japonica TaxID=7064 RepID=A0AAW1LCB8_POPJA
MPNSAVNADKQMHNHSSPEAHAKLRLKIAAYSYEVEQTSLQRLFEEVINDEGSEFDDLGEDQSNHCEEIDHDSESELDDLDSLMI